MQEAVSNMPSVVKDLIDVASLLSAGLKAQTHNGGVAQLGLNYVSKGLLTKDEGRLYSRLLQHCITGDYNDFFDFDREDVLPLLEPTLDLLAELENLIACP